MINKIFLTMSFLLSLSPTFLCQAMKATSERAEEELNNFPLKKILQDLSGIEEISDAWRVRLRPSFGKNVYRIVGRIYFTGVSPAEEVAQECIEQQVQRLKDPSLWIKLGTLSGMQKECLPTLERLFINEGALDSQTQETGNVVVALIPQWFASLLYKSKLFPDVLLAKDRVIIVPTTLRERDNISVLKVFYVEESLEDINQEDFKAKLRPIPRLLRKAMYTQRLFNKDFVIYRFKEDPALSKHFEQLKITLMAVRKEPLESFSCDLPQSSLE